MHNEMQLPLLGWSSRVGSSKVSPRDAPSLSPLTPPVRAAAVGCLLRRMYASVPSVSTSDHKPVVAAFDLLPSVPVHPHQAMSKDMHLVCIPYCEYEQ